MVADAVSCSGTRCNGWASCTSFGNIIRWKLTHTLRYPVSGACIRFQSCYPFGERLFSPPTENFWFVLVLECIAVALTYLHKLGLTEYVQVWLRTLVFVTLGKKKMKSVFFWSGLEGCAIACVIWCSEKTTTMVSSSLFAYVIAYHCADPETSSMFWQTSIRECM